MPEKVIAIENRKGPHQLILRRVMRMVPDKDKTDKNLQRLLAFRLEVDGEAATIEYLMRKIRDVIHCAYTGSLYDFLKNDRLSRECSTPHTRPDPPEPA